MNQGHFGIRILLGTFFSVSVLLLSITSAATLADLPVGHLKIEERGEGQLNVEARCVPLTDIIEKLSPYLDAPVQLTHPCLTHVSMSNPDKSATAEDWLRLLAMQGAEFTLVRRGDILSLEPTGGKLDFDPGLSEAEIMERFATKAPAAQTVRSGIASGVLLYQGHYVPGPYKVDFRTQSDRSCDITINGLTVSTLPKWGVEDERKRPPFVNLMPESGQFTEHDALVFHVVGRLSSGDLADVPWEQAREILWDFLRDQELIADVLTPGMSEEDFPYPLRFKELADSDALVVRLAALPTPGRFLPSNYDIETRTYYSMGTMYTALSDQQEAAKKTVDSHTERLGKGAVCVWSEAGYVEIKGTGSVSRLLDAIRQGVGRPVLERECLLAEVVESRRMARELAANLAGQEEALVTALERALDAPPEGGTPG